MYNRIRWVTQKRFCSTGLATLVSSRASTVDGIDSSPVVAHRNGLMEILRKSGPRRNLPSLLQNWIDSGHVVKLSELRSISKRLVKSNRYDLALQMMEWIETQKDIQLSADDYTLRLELIIRIHGLRTAEEYFEKLQSSSTSLKVAKSAYIPLLHAYVKKKLVQEAETLMEKLNSLGFLVTPHPFNEMMKLYETTYQYEKVVMVISLMKSNKIPRNVLSYNLWMNSSYEISGVESVESVYREMVNDKSVQVGWSSLCTLANVYIKANSPEKANLVLDTAEKMLNRSNRLGYLFLITLHTSLRNKEDVLRLWERSKSVNGKLTCANYICMLSSLVKLDELAEAARIFTEWETQCSNYDVRVSNVLLGAYTRNRQILKAESLHNRVLQRGGKPNFKTWEILMEGWVRCESMEKAIDAMHQAFELMENCHWRPSEKIVMAIVEYFEKEEKVEEAFRFVRDLQSLGIVSLGLYRVLLRMYAHAKRPAFDVYEFMKLDKIIMD